MTVIMTDDGQSIVYLFLNIQCLNDLCLCFKFNDEVSLLHFTLSKNKRFVFQQVKECSVFSTRK